MLRPSKSKPDKRTRHLNTDNRRIKEELGVRLNYPDFRKGIDACLEAERQAADPAR